MVVGEYKEPLTSENPIAFLPYTIKAIGEDRWIALLNLFLRTGALGVMVAIRSKDMALPDIKEICKL